MPINPPPIKIPDIADKNLQVYLKQFKDAFYQLWFQFGSGTGIIPLIGGGTGSDTASGARTNLGLGTIATQDASAVAITGGSITGITDLAVADGGTGASDASGARTNLGLGTIATQAANNVAITGGAIDGTPVGGTTKAAGGFTTLALDKTITAALTTGAQTINKPAGSVNFAAAATSLVVTNSLVTTSSVILATVATNDSTMKTVLCVAAAGSFTIHANAAATAETRVNFLVVN